MNRFVKDVLISGLAGGVLSHLVAAACSRVETGRGSRAVHAVSHIVWGDPPESHRGHKLHNWVLGSLLHQGACMFWAPFFEALFGKDAERSTPSALAGGAATATMAYVTDYHLVPRRLSPGFEAHLSGRSLFLVYAALAAGFAVSARLRGLHRHQVEDHHESDERRHAQSRPDAVVTPE